MNEDFATLRLFNEKVERLQATRFAKKYADTVPEVFAEWRSLSTSKGEGLSFEITGEVVSRLSKHDQDDIDAFVLTYRMFIQQNDRVSLASLGKVYARDWMPEEPRESFQHAMSVVDEYLDSPIALVVYDQTISRRQLVDTVLYGGLAHSDVKKEAVYRSWMESGAAGFFWVDFVVTMKDMTKYLAFYRELNEAVLANCAV
jgi:hypothetical protein